MRGIKFWLISVVSGIATILFEGLLRKAFTVLLCGVFAFSSSFCTSYLLKSIWFSSAYGTDFKSELISETDTDNGDNESNKNKWDPQDILKYAKNAAKHTPFECNNSVKEVANKLGVKIEGTFANDQVKWLEIQSSKSGGLWTKINREDAKEKAEQGYFVLVGKVNESDKNGEVHGHIAVVVTGISDRGYPPVAGGALSAINMHPGNWQITKQPSGITQEVHGYRKKGKEGKWIYSAYSEGILTVNYAWKRSNGEADRVSYFYYTPNKKVAQCNQLNNNFTLQKNKWYQASTQISKENKDFKIALSEFRPLFAENKQQNNDCIGGGTIGDPHLKTFDGWRYDLQTIGEFILVKANHGEFEVQTRHTRFNNSGSISINSAVAMKVGSDRVAFYGQYFPDADTINPLRVNGKITTIQGNKLKLNGGGNIFRQGNLYVVDFPMGEKVVVSSLGTGNTTFFNILPFVNNQAEVYSGLLGNVNGNPKDDLQIRGGGNFLEVQSTYGDLNQVLNKVGLRLPGALNRLEQVYFDQLYKQFANSWRVKKGESLFDYPDNKNTKDYLSSSFPDKYLKLDMLSPEQIQKANNACIKAHVTQDLIEDCIFDVGFSGFSGFARAISEVNSYISTINQLFPRLNISTPEQTVKHVIEKVKPKKCLFRFCL